MQNNTGIIAGIIVLLIVAGGGYMLWKSPQNTPSDVVPETATGTNTDTASGPNTDAGTPPATDSGTPAAGTFTTTQVSAHNSSSSCWSIIDGNVYDLTNWIGQHPGGSAAIKQLCGKDGTALFHGQHGNAQQQASILATMKIGVLAK